MKQDAVRFHPLDQAPLNTFLVDADLVSIVCDAPMSLPVGIREGWIVLPAPEIDE